MWDGCKPYEQVPAQLSCHVTNGGAAALHITSGWRTVTVIPGKRWLERRWKCAGMLG